MNSLARSINPPLDSAKAANAIALRIALFGAAIYGLLAFGLVLKTDHAAYGTDLYDAYYLALLEGRFNLPAIILGYEGHYLPDGTGFLYHGVAPLITRFVFGWFLPLDTVSLAPFSIWLWATIGTALYHAAFHRLTLQHNAQAASATTWSALLAGLCWFAAPGLIISTNTALYHEPIAIAYAATAGFVYAFIAARNFGLSWFRACLIMAAMAAVCVHSRPNLAVGLYAGVVLLSGWLFVSNWRKYFLTGILAMSILGASGLGYLAINAAKFGNAGVTHGSFTKTEIQYGTTYWGGESAANSERAKAFVEHGRFNVRRIVPNLTLYAFDPPFFLTSEKTAEDTANWFHSITQPVLGFIRIEGPRIGFAFLWAVWLAIAVYGLMRRQAIKVVVDHAPIVLASGTAALLTFSYATITLRYRFDIWPLIAVLALIAWPVVAKSFSAFENGWRRLALIAIVLISVQSSILTTIVYRTSFTQFPGSFFEPWTQEQCITRAEKKGLSDERAETICTR